MSKSVILSIVEKFCCSGSVLCQRKGPSGCRKTVGTNENERRVFEHASHAFTARKQSLFINMFTDLQNRFKVCLGHNGAHFGHLDYKHIKNK